MFQLKKLENNTLICVSRDRSSAYHVTIAQMSLTSFIDFRHSCEFAANAAKKNKNNCFRQQNSRFRKRFLDTGLHSMLRSLIRILRASLVQLIRK